MAAREEVHNAQMTLSGAAKHFGVPRKTLRCHVTGNVSMNSRIGRPTVLMKEEEDEKVETGQVFAYWGFGLQKEEIKSVVAQFCHAAFKQTQPFQEWNTR